MDPPKDFSIAEETEPEIIEPDKPKTEDYEGLTVLEIAFGDIRLALKGKESMATLEYFAERIISFARKKMDSKKRIGIG